ncbi:hypothetical protein [Sphingobacterium lactis]|uniref:Uncharacterized protein n=1 Tax=Sphingobacterium lactis TaxID=797291 RepID=A0A1H5VD70_9SPHI|nr:hypothetical protein [Sphingobacterium lactis]SEF84788.1 hypothetical protein SAMN05421877_10385 [Sphingobacterium lactis]
MKHHKNIVRYIYLLFAALTFAPALLFGQSAAMTDKIWNAVGGKSKWESTKYIMFTVSGNNKYPAVSGSRKFLLDKQSGNVRFEGTLNNENVVALINVQSQKLNHIYDENGSELTLQEYKSVLPDLIDQYNLDLKVLSLPISILAANISGQDNSKIINAEKLQKLDFSNFLGSKGSFYVSEETGFIKRLEINNKTFAVNGYKDIGNGLVLPTSFKSSGDNITYQKVASFTEMEPEKFKEF